MKLFRETCYLAKLSIHFIQTGFFDDRTERMSLRHDPPVFDTRSPQYFVDMLARDTFLPRYNAGGVQILNIQGRIAKVVRSVLRHLGGLWRARRNGEKARKPRADTGRTVVAHSVRRRARKRSGDSRFRLVARVFSFLCSGLKRTRRERRKYGAQIFDSLSGPRCGNGARSGMVVGLL